MSKSWKMLAKFSELVFRINAEQHLSAELRIILPESEIAEPLGVIAAKYPELSFGSYPFITNGVFGANIVVRGTDPVMLAKGVSDLREIFADSA